MSIGNPVRVGFIGAGDFVSRHHLYTAGHSEIMAVHAICDLDAARLSAHAARYSPRYTTREYRKILDDPEVEVVVIGTRQELHAPLIIESLAAGIRSFREGRFVDLTELR